MTNTYNIKGMTCSSCKSSVEKSLGDLNEVTNVEVNLENEEVTVTMDSHIKLTKLQKVLSSKYTITDKIQKNVFATNQTSSFEIEEEKKQISTDKTTFAYPLLYNNSKYIITLQKLELE